MHVQAESKYEHVTCSSEHERPSCCDLRILPAISGTASMHTASRREEG
jgi:hypothetical protein